MCTMQKNTKYSIYIYTIIVLKYNNNFLSGAKLGDNCPTNNSGFY